MILDVVAVTLGNIVLELLDALVEELDDSARFEAHHVVMMRTVRELEHGGAALEVVAAHEARLLELGEDAVNRCQSELLAAVEQLARTVVSQATPNRCVGATCPGVWGWSSPYIFSAIASPPAARPILRAYLGGEPDYVVPSAIESDPEASRLFRASMERAWDGIERLRALGVPAEWRAYLLPNAVSVRFTESSDLLNLHHKLKMRLCWNAQEEIWRASRDEAEQILAVEPRIGRWLLPPCGIRARAGAKPICPEGDRYCGVPVWRLSLEEQARIV